MRSHISISFWRIDLGKRAAVLDAILIMRAGPCITPNTRFRNENDPIGTYSRIPGLQLVEMFAKYRQNFSTGLLADHMGRYY